jgi:hypothetical protein
LTARTLVSRKSLFILSGAFAILAIVAAAAIAYVSAKASAEEATLERLTIISEDRRFKLSQYLDGQLQGR